MNCCGINKSLEKYKQSTAFEQDEINDIYSYFNKYSKNKLTMNFQ